VKWQALILAFLLPSGFIINVVVNIHV